MSSQFNRSYHVTSSTVLSADLWNSVFQNIDLRLIGIEEKKASFEQAEQQLLELGLRRINETLQPAAEKIFALSEMGFLVASSEELIKPIDGQMLSVHLIKGVQSDLFTPSPFIALVRRSTPDSYAIGELLHYDRGLARVDMKIVSVQGVVEPYDDWDVAALAGSVKAMWDALIESRQIRDDVVTKHSDIQANAADVVAKHGAIATSHADFVSTWFGARDTPPDNAKIGAMYLDTGSNPAQVKVKTPQGWVVAALAADSVYTKQQADNKYLPKAGGTLTGELTVQGSKVQVGTAKYYNTGDINGTVWEEWHQSGWIKDAIEAKAQEIADAKIDARCVTNVRLAGYAQTPWWNTHSSTEAALPSGYVATSGWLNAGRLAHVGGRQLQIKIPDIGWRAVAIDDE